MYDSTVVLALIALGATFITSLTGLITAYFRHKEQMHELNKVANSVNGKMDKLLAVTGDAREAIGKLKGKEERY